MSRKAYCAITALVWVAMDYLSMEGVDSETFAMIFGFIWAAIILPDRAKSGAQ